MKRNILLYGVSSILLCFILYFFNKTYSEIVIQSELLGTNHSIHGHYQQLSTQLNKAAVITPDLLSSAQSETEPRLFYVDSAAIIGLVTRIKSELSNSSDTVIVVELELLIKTEISWLLKSDLPDSIIAHQSINHVIAYKRMDHLINTGIQHTEDIIKARTSQLGTATSHIRLGIIAFIILSSMLLLLTLLTLVRQKSKGQRKELEMETILNRISDGVVSVDKNWRYTFLNNTALLTHPLGRQETLGKVIWDIHPEMKGTIFWDSYHEAMKTKKVLEIESYYAPLSIWFSVRIYPSDDGLTIFYKDVTDAKISEQKLALTLKELTDYKVALDESSIVAITDQKGIIRHANDNFCRISKFSRDELIGQDHRIINSGYHSKDFIRTIWTTIAAGEVWKGELKNRAKDGTIYWVDTTIVPFINEQGKPYRYVAIRSDITARKQAEVRLVESEKIYKTIASSIPGSVICLLDSKYTYLLIEGDMLEALGYSKEQLLGKRAADILPADVYEGLKGRLDQARKGQVVTHESTQSGFDIITRYIPLKDDNNTVYAIMTVSIDITELKNAQRSISDLNRDLEEKIKNRTEELRKSNEEMEAFSYSVSHDLRAPLRGIIGFAKILHDEYGIALDAEAKRIIGIVMNNAQKMGCLIDDLLAFSRTGKIPLMKSHINLSEMLAELISDQGLSPSSSIEWNIQRMPSPYADANLFRQVWINLISNAIKYSSTKAKPIIDIGSEAGDGKMIFYVKDNGVGFDEAYAHKLFKVFQRLHDADEFEGTGVGLALVEKIISRHGGEVWATGKEGEGASFYFSLPNST